MSKKYTFNSKDLKDVAVMAVVTGLGAAVVFILDNVLPFVDFGQFNGIIVPLIPVVTYSAKKFIQGK